MYFDLFKISRVMLYILKIIRKCLPASNFKCSLEAVTCHTCNIYVQQTLSKTVVQQDKYRCFLGAF